MKLLTKLDALRILSNAFYYLLEDNGSNPAGTEILHDQFHKIRRSLRIEELQPQRDVEGWNGRMPTQF